MRIPYGIYNKMVLRGLIRELPTARLYFLNYVEHLPRTLRASLRYLGQNVYALGRTAFVVRETSTFGLRQAKKLDRIFYILDDNFRAGADDETLPFDYRHKLRRLHDEVEYRILDACDALICANESSAAFYRSRGDVGAVETLYPHFGAAKPRMSPVRSSAVHLALLQTRSHLNDVRSIAAPLNKILARHSEASLIHFLKGSETGLRPNKRIVEIRPMPWRAYMRWRKRIDIGLYPLLDGGFNSYRSINKFLEYVHRGAVPLVSENPAMQALPAQFRVKDGDWFETMTHLIRDADARDAAYEAAHAYVAEMRFFERSLDTLRNMLDA